MKSVLLINVSRSNMSYSSRFKFCPLRTIVTENKIERNKNIFLIISMHYPKNNYRQRPYITHILYLPKIAGA
jgi:hypothetical protein